jgi:HD-like signal output (HDOD) protein
MWAQLKNLFFPSPSLPGPGIARSRPLGPGAHGLPEDPCHEIEQAFLGLVLGVHSPSDAPLNRFESRALRTLEGLIDGGTTDNNLVPRLPAVLPRIMNYFRDPSTTGKELAELIARDMVSVSEVIRLANSSYYRRASEVRSIEQAVVVLGQRGLRQMVANLLVRPIFSVRQGHFSAIAGPLLWVESEKTALVCAALARQARGDEFSAYLAGISSNLGLLAGCRVLDSLFDGKDVPSGREFRIRWQRAARQLTVRMAGDWEFPQSACELLAALTEASAGPGSADDLLGRAERFSRFQSLRIRGRIPGFGAAPLEVALSGEQGFEVAMAELNRFAGNSTQP